MLHLLRPVTLTRKNVPGFEMFKCFAETPAIILSLLEILKKTNLTAIIILSIIMIKGFTIQHEVNLSKRIQTNPRHLGVCDTGF